MTTTIYLGPYLVIPPTTMKSISPERECSNHCDAPAVYPPAKFCGNCGGAVSWVNAPIEEVKPLSIMELDRKWEDFMFRPEYGQRHPGGDMWLPNRGKHGISFDRGSHESFTPVLLADLDGDAMLRKAQRDYGGFVSALKKDFGVDAFWEVGIVAYAS
jgi:hypothetical protein